MVIRRYPDEALRNMSGIMRNLEQPPLPAVSPHWPSPGRYVGIVDDVETWIILKEVKRLKLGLENIKNRVYQDELDYFNGEK